MKGKFLFRSTFTFMTEFFREKYHRVYRVLDYVCMVADPFLSVTKIDADPPPVYTNTK